MFIKFRILLAKNNERNKSLHPNFLVSIKDQIYCSFEEPLHFDLNILQVFLGPKC